MLLHSLKVVSTITFKQETDHRIFLQKNIYREIPEHIIYIYIYIYIYVFVWITRKSFSVVRAYACSIYFPAGDGPSHFFSGQICAHLCRSCSIARLNQSQATFGPIKLYLLLLSLEIVSTFISQHGTDHRIFFWPDLCYFVPFMQHRLLKLSSDRCLSEQIVIAPTQPENGLKKYFSTGDGPSLFLSGNFRARLCHSYSIARYNQAQATFCPM